MGWAPVFSKIVDSSIWRESDTVVKVFLTMLAKKHSDHVVYANAFMIGEWAKKGEQEVLDALHVLASPDTKRIEKQPFDGRRIEKVEGGWKILNGEFYEEEMRREMLRARKAKWARENRERERAIDFVEQSRQQKPKRKRRGPAGPGEGAVRNGAEPGETADRVNAEIAENLEEKRQREVDPRWDEAGKQHQRQDDERGAEI